MKSYSILFYLILLVTFSSCESESISNETVAEKPIKTETTNEIEFEGNSGLNKTQGICPDGYKFVFEINPYFEINPPAGKDETDVDCGSGFGVCAGISINVGCEKRGLPYSPILPEYNEETATLVYEGVLMDDKFYMYAPSEIVNHPDAEQANDFEIFSLKNDITKDASELGTLTLLEGDYEKQITESGNFLYIIDYELN
ncbi:hypothetical protein [Mesonia maritima]|uniref:Lipoprotein n=1 Tax=Mesonia maritima TaxID=1793873 RepID=A0ABU1K3C2_9FLAO|nr:hypothetical protein [Mesonia maritima]MDR6300109.1 hypothetical protein [Mesonia maritima]